MRRSFTAIQRVLFNQPGTTKQVAKAMGRKDTTYVHRLLLKMERQPIHWQMQTYLFQKVMNKKLIIQALGEIVLKLLKFIYLKIKKIWIR